MGYPPPPWRTRGHARFRAFLVDASSVRPPEGLRVEARAGLTLGLLGYVRYEPPSPLSYHELLWMPARVTAIRADGSRARGWYVAKMLVDDDDSLAAGREVWALPKQRAKFEIEGPRVTVRGEDGSHVVWTDRASFGRLPGRGSVISLQRREDELIAFRGDFRGTLVPAVSRVETSGLDGTWQGLEGARPLGPLGARLEGFFVFMNPLKSASISTPIDWYSRRP